MGKKYNEEILEKSLPPYLENDLKNLNEGLKNNWKKRWKDMCNI